MNRLKCYLNGWNASLFSLMVMAVMLCVGVGVLTSQAQDEAASVDTEGREALLGREGDIEVVMRPPLEEGVVDSDGDGAGDGDEEVWGYDQFNVEDGYLDEDGDGLDFAWEMFLGSDPFDALDPMQGGVEALPDEAARMISSRQAGGADAGAGGPGPVASVSDFSSVPVKYDGGSYLGFALRQFGLIEGMKRYNRWAKQERWNFGAAGETFDGWRPWVGDYVNIVSHAGKVTLPDGSLSEEKVTRSGIDVGAELRYGFTGVEKDVELYKGVSYVVVINGTKRPKKSGNNTIRLSYTTADAQEEVVGYASWTANNQWVDRVMVLKIPLEEGEVYGATASVTLRMRGGAGRGEDFAETMKVRGALVSKVSLLPVEVVDINGHDVEDDDVVVAPWDVTKNIAENNIAWIDAHSGEDITIPVPAGNAITLFSPPRMPQLELRVQGLPDGLSLEAKLKVEHRRAFVAREENRIDRVSIPANGEFRVIEGHTWSLFDDEDWHQEIEDNNYFGGTATLTYKIRSGDKIVVDSRVIQFRIGGENPEDERCKEYINSKLLNDGVLKSFAWFGYAIGKSESKGYNSGQDGAFYNQFYSAPQHPNDNGIPLHVRSSREEGAGGVGIYQITGYLGDKRSDARREVYWDWQANINSFIDILRVKWTESPYIFNDSVKPVKWSSGGDAWMNSSMIRTGKGWENSETPHGQRPQAEKDVGNDVPVLDGNVPHQVQEISFKDGSNKPIEHAVLIKLYNGGSFYCAWSGKGWKFNTLNALGFNYVDRVINELD